MEQFQRHFFSDRFGLAFMRSKGTAFQDLFTHLMELAYPDDFVTVRPYGASGDLKCDGYLTSQKAVHQCYAPREMKLALLLTKMKVDFTGALGHWKSQMAKWILVHNDNEGIPAEALQLLNDFSANNAAVTTHQWGYNALLDIVLKLPIEKLERLLGPAPPLGAVATIGNDDIAAAVHGIQQFDPGIANDVPVAPTTAKLNENGFSTPVRELLRGGMIGAERVGVFFARYPVPDFVDKVAAAFRREYDKLGSNGDLAPDSVYNELFRFAGGDVGDERRRAAVLAVLSYFFERCDIFKEPAAVK